MIADLLLYYLAIMQRRDKLIPSTRHNRDPLFHRSLLSQEIAPLYSRGAVILSVTDYPLILLPRE